MMTLLNACQGGHESDVRQAKRRQKRYQICFCFLERSRVDLISGEFYSFQLRLRAIHDPRGDFFRERYIAGPLKRTARVSSRKPIWWVEGLL